MSDTVIQTPPVQKSLAKVDHRDATRIWIIVPGICKGRWSGFLVFIWRTRKISIEGNMKKRERTLVHKDPDLASFGISSGGRRIGPLYNAEMD